MNLFLVDIHEKNKKNSCSHTQLYGLEPYFPVDRVLMLLYQVAYFRERAFLNTYITDEEDLIYVDIVYMTYEFFALEFVRKKTEKEKEESMRVRG